MNDYGDFATYAYNQFDPDNVYVVKVGLLYWGHRDLFGVDKNKEPMLP